MTFSLSRKVNRATLANRRTTFGKRRAMKAVWMTSSLSKKANRATPAKARMTFGKRPAMKAASLISLLR